jgi:putative DNA primase/helicase
MTETTDNIVRLAALQDSDSLKPGSEDAMALAFAERYAAELRFVARWGRWLHYAGTRWQHDDTLAVFDRVRALCREVALECGKSAKTSASAKTVAAVERLARSDRRLAATAAQWDAEPWFLNTADSTFDLRTANGQPPAHTDYITKQTACVAAPTGTPHPLWTAFLQRVTDDDTELQQFLQRYIGYCLTGLTVEHRFVFAYGTGANGKGTFINSIAGIFGNYATSADMGTFIATNNERHPTDLAKLAGARLVVAQETERGRRWDESKIKNLTGGDTISARFMRQDFFDFTPSFKLLIAGNHKPRMSGVDEAMRRRLLLVPFTVQIPVSERDLNLPDKLKAEWPAILRWCLNGCLEWQRIGLAPPESVRAATENYFSDQDTLGQWLDDCTEDGGPLAFTRIKDLFASWKDWTEARNYKPGTTMALSDMLVDRGFVKKRESNTGQRGFAGLTVKVKGG